MKISTLFFFLAVQLTAFCQQDGALDVTFDLDGMRTIQTGLTTNSVGMGFQSTGKLIVGLLEDNNGAPTIKVARLLEDGSYDYSFGNLGIQSVSFDPGYYGYPTNIAIQPDDKIVIGCVVVDDLFQRFYGIVRLDSQGYLDSSFGENGIVLTAVDTSEIFGGMYGMGLQPDGRILLFGTTAQPMNNQFVLFRLLSDGSMDTSFGEENFQYVNASFYEDMPLKAYFTSDNKILIGGNVLVPTGGALDPAYDDLLIVKLNMDGSPDMTFGDEGIFTTNLDSLGDRCPHIVFNDDGSFFAAGYITDGDDNNTNGIGDYLLCKFTQNGAFDETFGVGGFNRYDLSESNDYPSALLKDDEGRLILVGSSLESPNYSNISLLRVLPDGTKDSTFGLDGVATHDLFGSLDETTTALFTPDNKIVVCGISNVNGDVWSTVSRYINDEEEISVNETASSAIGLYPNPCKDFMRISGNVISLVSARIFDSTGKLIATKTANSNLQFDTEYLSTGVYYVEVSKTDGSAEWLRFVRL